MRDRSIWPGSIWMQRGNQQDRSVEAILSAGSTEFKPTERGVAHALQHGEIDQVLLGYLYSGAAFS
jgi:hypothetical protein